MYGPRQRPDLAISKFIRLIDEGKPVPVFGDGSSGRDYTYCEDVVAGIAWAMQNRDAVRTRIRVGQDYVEQKFSPHAIGVQWQDELRELLSQPVTG